MYWQYLYPIFQCTRCICILYFSVLAVSVLYISVYWMYLYPIFQCSGCICILYFSVLDVSVSYISLYWQYLYPIFQCNGCICTLYFSLLDVSVSLDLDEIGRTLEQYWRLRTLGQVLNHCLYVHSKYFTFVSKTIKNYFTAQLGWTRSDFFKAVC